MKRLIPGLLALSFPAFGEEIPTYRGEEIVVTAARVPQKASTTLANVTIIDARDIAASGQTSLTDLLSRLGGVEVASNGGLGQPASIFVRGSNSSHVLVLVDGVRIGSATAGTTAIENIPLDLVERVEIVRGPLSDRYGSDAIGGAIQIFTRRGNGDVAPYLSLGAGSYDTHSTSAGIGGKSGDVRFNLQAAYTDHGGFSATNSSARFGIYNPDRDGYRNASVSGNLNWQLGANHELGASLMRSENNIHYDQTPTTDDYSNQLLEAYALFLNSRLTSNWDSRVQVSLGVDDRASFGAFPSKFRTDQKQALWQHNFSLDSGRVTAGLEYLGQKVGGSTDFTLTQRTTRAVFAGYEGALGAHRLQVNARHDDNSQFGGYNTGSVGYGYKLTTAWELVASAGRAFKAPTFNDLYYPFTDYGYGYTYSGNPNLKPERSFNREIGARYQQGNHHLKLAAFENRISDLISLSSDYSTVTNIGAARIRGEEIEYRGKWGEYALRANVGLQEPTNLDTGALLPKRAKRFGSLSVQRDMGAWSWGTEYTASGARYDSAENKADTRMGGYGLLNLFVTYHVKPDLALQARWNNVLDRQYELAQGFNTPGSNVFVSLRYTPK